ncbi:MAG TPA: serine/threonine-protein kinase [Polyangiaceae bacterium]
MARLTAAPEAERRLGPFVLVEQLGRGGFAPVWLAREMYGQTMLRGAAVKLFALPSGARAERERARIVDEARALCRVEHPNVVRFYALAMDGEQSVMGLAMEHVAGKPLDQRLLEAGPLDASATLAIGAAVASALAAVHRSGLVHRDVKPSNVVEAAGVYKLIDFGIAGVGDDAEPAPATDRQDPQRTERIGQLAGTSGYIDPECLAGRRAAEPASDLYALGATLFACLTCRLPASSADGLNVDILEGHARAPALSELVPSVPAALSALIAALLEPGRSMRPRSAEWVAIRIEQIRRELIGDARALPSEEIGPFRGLGRFDSEDREVYFGRSAEVAAALESLRGRGVVALLGPSGSGKSSLARAGLLPAVAEGALGEHPRAWDVVTASPGVDAKGSLLLALAPFVDNVDQLGAVELVARLAERVHTQDRGTLLFLDQFEELATLSDPATTSFVVALLREIGERPLAGVRAVLAARRDLLDPLLALSELGSVVLRGSILVEPFSVSAWGEVIDRALAAYGYGFQDSELRDEVLAELGTTSDAMPLVQFALTELWRRRDVESKRLTRRALHSLGGITGALEKHAEASVARLLESGLVTESVARAFLLSLTTPRGTRATRTRAELERYVGPLAGQVAAALEAERLIVQQADGFTLAHEALISRWGRLAGWLAEEREERLLAESLERATLLWLQDAEHAPRWRKLRLEAGERLARDTHVDLSDEAKQFLDVCRRDERNRRLGLFGVLALLVLGAALGTVSYLRAVHREQARTAAALAEEQESRRLAESRTREVEAAQTRIDQLLKDLADSPKKDEVLALQQQIRTSDTALVPVRSPPARTPEPRPKPALEPTPAPASKPSATPSAIKVQKDW